MKNFKALMVAVGLLLALAVPSFAQTTLNSTTLAAAVTSANTNQFQLASTTNVSVGDYLAIVHGNVVREIAQVRSVASPYVTVTRDAVGFSTERRARLHASGSTVYTGARGRFYGAAGSADVAGSCTRAQEQFLPHISLQSGYIYQCSPAGVWYRLDQQQNIVCQTGALATGSVDQSCWTVDGNYVITKITYVAKTAEAAGTLTIIPRRQQSTEAPASGDALATAINAVAAGTAAETVTDFTLTATSALLLLSEDERLGLDFTDDVAGELAGVVVTFTVAPR
jgi:hypothetical protein